MAVLGKVVVRGQCGGRIYVRFGRGIKWRGEFV